MSLFVDTSIWYAVADSSDRSNARSKAILRSGETMVTSDHVLVETWTLLHHKLDRKAAEGLWEGLRSGIALIEAVTLADLRLPGMLAFLGVTRIFPSSTAPASL